MKQEKRFTISIGYLLIKYLIMCFVSLKLKENGILFQDTGSFLNDFVYMLIMMFLPFSIPVVLIVSLPLYYILNHLNHFNSFKLIVMLLFISFFEGGVFYIYHLKYNLFSIDYIIIGFICNTVILAFSFLFRKRVI